MYPSQLRDLSSSCRLEISNSIGEILALAREIVDNGHLERKFMVFPLFMAGFASDDANDKDGAMNLLMALEREAMGKVARASRDLLEIVYEKQNEEMSRVGHVLDVDWVQILVEKGLQIASCRL